MQRYDTEAQVLRKYRTVKETKHPSDAQNRTVSLAIMLGWLDLSQCSLSYNKPEWDQDLSFLKDAGMLLIISLIGQEQFSLFRLWHAIILRSNNNRKPFARK